MGIVRGSKIIKDPYGEAENSNIDYVKQRKLRLNVYFEKWGLVFYGLRPSLGGESQRDIKMNTRPLKPSSETWT